MRYSIHQLDATTWELRAPDGTSLSRFSDGAGRTGYDLALVTLGQIITTDLAAAPMPVSGDGLLPEGWASDGGIAFSEKLAGGRDFSSCAWSWRDPVACLVPLMFQTENEGGHYGAELVGFFTEIAQASGTVTGRGRFYDSEIAATARDVLLDGRRFGISVDPSEKVEAEYDFTCTEWDDDGFCIMGEESVVFSAYEIAGATMCPFPGFEQAAIVLDTEPAAASVAPVRAAAPTAPPRRDLLTLAEPAPGTPFLDRMGEDVLVEQIDREGNVVGMAYPLTITEPIDGYRYGFAHLTYWGQCHTGNPWGPNLCASAQPSENGYADFHAGEMECSDGTAVPTGRLVVGCEHSDAMDIAGVRDHMAHAGMGWASAHVVDGQFGPWMCAVLDPSLTDSQIQLLRSLSLSGEWVGELGGILAVNASGLPVQRERLAASFSDWADIAPDGKAIRVQFVVPQAALRASVKGGEVTKLVGGNMVRSCPECQKRARLAASANGNGHGQLDRIEAALTRLDLRTKHLIGAEATAVRERLAASARTR